MPAPLLVPDNLASAGIESLFYGIFVALSAASVTLSYMRDDKQRVKKSWLDIFKPMRIGSIFLFLGVTLHWATTITRLFQAFAYFQDGAAPTLFYADLTQASLTAKTSSVLITCLAGDAMIIFRLWIVWGRNLWIIIPPLITQAGLAVCGVGMIYTLSHYDATQDIFASSAGQWITSDFVLTLVTNVYCTGLVAWRIWIVNRRSNSSGLVRLSRTNLTSTLAILVESAAIYTTWTVVCLIVYRCASNVLFPIADILPVSAGISFMLINVRAGLGWAQTSQGAPAWSVDIQSRQGGQNSMATRRAPARGVESVGYGMKPFEVNISQSVIRGDNSHADSTRDDIDKPTEILEHGGSERSYV